jgi:hypothetical protein
MTTSNRLLKMIGKIDGLSLSWFTTPTDTLFSRRRQPIEVRVFVQIKTWQSRTIIFFII